MNASPLRLSLAALSLGLAVGCGPKPIPLTAELRTEHRLRAEDLRNLQLYVSDDVTLRREAESLDRRIDRGALRLRAGKTVDEIVIRRRTPCLAAEVRDASILVAFEDGSTLAFELPESMDPEPVTREPLVLGPRFSEPPSRPLLAAPAPELPPASGLQGSYQLAARGGLVRYRDADWAAVDDSLRAHLLIATEELSDVDENRTVVGGRRL